MGSTSSRLWDRGVAALTVAERPLVDKVRRPPGRRAGVSVAALAALLGALAAEAPAQVPPDARWRTLDTEHFHVTFPEGLEHLGREAGVHAERAWARLVEVFPAPTAGRTEIVLSDGTDVSNGLAGVAPYKRIVVWVTPPVDGLALSYYDDWLELVLTHELAHVFHLDVGGDLASVLRTVFGRVPVNWPFFPNHSVPGWAIEGLATWYESALSASGRVRGTYHEMVLRTALLEGRFEDVDEASGQSPVWPGGNRPYVYGSLFFDHMLARRGPEALRALADAVAGQWIPYRLDAAGRKAFGVSVGDAWAAWREAYRAEVDSLTRSFAARAPLTAPERLTTGARLALQPAVSPGGGALLFASSDGRSDPQLRVASPDGSAKEQLTRTNGMATFSWLADGSVAFSQLDFEDAHRFYLDLWVADRSGATRRVTRGARVEHPSADPDGRRVVAVQHGGGTNRLVEVDLAEGGVVPVTDFAPDTHWAFPAVSPDGRWVAVSRWRSGAYFDVVVLDRGGAVVAQLTGDRAVDMAPAWSPDGRWIVWASDRSGVPNLLAAPFEPGTGGVGAVRQVTNLLTGAAFPSVDPSGSWIYFSSYHADGWEVARVPFDPSGWTEPFPLDPRFVVASGGGEEAGAPGETASPATAGGAGAQAAGAAGEVRDYAPWRMLVPRYWQPEVRPPIAASGRDVIGTAVGLTTSAEDVVGRHRVDLFAVVSTSGGETDAAASYRWAGLGNPVIEVSAQQFWDAAGPLAGRRDDETVDTLWLTERERRVVASVTHRNPGFRLSSSVSLGAGLVRELRTILDDRLEESTLFRPARPESTLGDLLGSLSVSSARAHAFSIGLEEGASLVLNGRARREMDVPDSVAGVPGFDRSFDEARGQLRFYESIPGPGFADHVLALQLAGGVARGPGADRFHLDVGGNPGLREPITGFSLFGGPFYFLPVRGYTNGERSGRYAWSLAAEYRFPLALVHDGFGLLPVYVDRLSGSLFLDAGNAWGSSVPGENPRRNALTSLGAEVVADLLTFFEIPLTLRTGVAVPLLEGRGAELYVRIGRPF